MSNKLPEKIRKRMEKLLAMSKDSCNENESSIATRRLHALLAEHNLSESEIIDGIKDVGSDQFDYKNNPWMRHISRSIAELYFCNMYYVKFSSTKVSIVISGSAVNREFALSLIQNVLKTIDTGALASSRAQYGRKNLPYITSFRNGASMRIIERCDDLKQQAQSGNLKTEEGTTLPSLTPVYEREQQKIQDWFKEIGKNIKTVSSTMRSNNSNGYSAGQSAADKVNLNRGIESQAPKQLGMA